MFASDMPPRRDADLLSFAVICIGFATQKTRRPVFLRAFRLTEYAKNHARSVNYLNTVKEVRQFFRTFSHPDN